MPGRRAPHFRGGTPSGGTTPAVGSLVLSASSLALSIPATTGSTAYMDDTFELSNGGPGNWTNPQYSIGYSAASGWLTLTSTNTGSFVFTPTIDATALTASTQTATITFTDTNVSNGGVQFAIVLTVTAATTPTMGLTPTSLSFTVLDETQGAAQSITVANSSTGTLAKPTIGTVTGDTSYLFGTAVTGSSPGPYTVTVTPTAVGGTPGSYALVIPLQSSGAVNSPINLPVAITVTSTQSAALKLDRLLDDASFTLGGSNPADKTVGITNIGSGALAGPTVSAASYSGSFTGWATGTISNVSSFGATLTVAVDCTGIVTPGTSVATLTVSDANAAVSVAYQVSLITSGATLSPILNVQPGAGGGTIVVGQSLADQTITITNSNGSVAQLGTVSCTTTGTTAVSVAYVAATGIATLHFTTSGLSAGQYTGTLSVAATLATNSPVSIPITITVNAAATSYAAPVFTLPSFSSHSTVTDLVTGTPYTKPALNTFA